jgi:hypothetical protein
MINRDIRNRPHDSGNVALATNAHFNWILIYWLIIYCLRHAQELFTNMEKSPLPVKGCKI